MGLELIGAAMAADREDHENEAAVQKQPSEAGLYIAAVLLMVFEVGIVFGLYTGYFD